MATGVVSNLKNEQRAAVDWSGNLLLTACPGSGKTRTLVAKLARVVEEVRGSARMVCCITYSNAGVQEIQARVDKYLSVDDGRHLTVCTIHSLCLNEIIRPYSWLWQGFHKVPDVLTADNPLFAAIADHAIQEISG